VAILLDQGCDLGWRSDGAGGNLFSGRTELGYTLYADGTQVQARRTVAVIETSPGSGYYETTDVVGGGLEVPDFFRGTVVWDDPVTGDIARDTIDLRPGRPVGAGGGSSDNTGTLPNILRSLQQRLDDIPDFASSLPGGYFTGPPSPDADDNPPYMVITRIGGTDTDWVTAAGENGAYIQGPIKTAFEDVFQTTLVGYDFDQLDLIHDLWTDNFNARMNPLVIRRRLFKGLFNKEPTYDFGDSPGDPQGGNMVVYRWEFSIVTTIWER
jgi:hypothetical protein